MQSQFITHMIANDKPSLYSLISLLNHSQNNSHNTKNSSETVKERKCQLIHQLNENHKCNFIPSSEKYLYHTPFPATQQDREIWTYQLKIIKLQNLIAHRTLE